MNLSWVKYDASQHPYETEERGGAGAWEGALTLQPLSLVALDHDAELQHQLRGALQEGLQQPQHVDIGILVHHGPVETPLVLLLPVALDAKVHGADVPVGTDKSRAVSRRAASRHDLLWGGV